MGAGIESVLLRGVGRCASSPSTFHQVYPKTMERRATHVAWEHKLKCLKAGSFHFLIHNLNVHGSWDHQAA